MTDVVSAMENRTVRLSGPLDPRDRWAANRVLDRPGHEVVGTRSAFLLLREAFYGTTRFDDFADRVGISRAGGRRPAPGAGRPGPARARALPAARPADPDAVPADRQGRRAVPRADRAHAVGRPLARPVGAPVELRHGLRRRGLTPSCAALPGMNSRLRISISPSARAGAPGRRPRRTWARAAPISYG